MVITQKAMDSKLGMFILAGFTPNGSGWDTAIPQSHFDALSKMGIDNPGAWFVMDCSNRPWTLHHIGEAYQRIVDHRSKANEEIFGALYDDKSVGVSKLISKGVVNHIQCSDSTASEASAGFLDLNLIVKAYNQGWEDGSKWQEQFLLQSEWSEKREGEKKFCFVIRTKEYACSGTNYVVHMMTDDGGFHHGDYCDEAVDAMARFLERCKLRNLSPLPLVNETN